ncbi:hypothetical protein T4B_5670 [Trichinella pseudospiralis]|uniref:Uncharacterized protein n=1 Tax=Trichinella pseudospiralis TaxID=6337 RepID=A0A0V1EXQ1_TRIPS|nr:hypothetical protein T4A_9606 [Trichinella pseudospiralis]KRZ32837.1 hypothetical protein T4B_5670 [Trichinella pseudospiralis]KRZ46125.1 hypothetical protein T4C_7405 [Trichinella pseudospiralis]
MPIRNVTYALCYDYFSTMLVTMHQQMQLKEHVFFKGHCKHLASSTLLENFNGYSLECLC